MDCLKCEKNLKCELQKMAADLGVYEIKYEGERNTYGRDYSSPAIVKDMEKCILCRRCVTMCNDIQKVACINTIDRGFDRTISTFFSKPLSETELYLLWAMCSSVCPTGALREVNNMIGFGML